ncbi:hypothetical protein ACZ90_51010 [Streptomyces albus subsp. albus]|nr:hypothetical protein ACZ90_51010 [Streptomyces albus subsp. albus]
MTTTARHEIRALLRAHLSAAAGYRHSTRHCPVCRRLLRLAMEPSAREAGHRGETGDTRGTGDAGEGGSGSDTRGGEALSGPAAGEPARCR